MLKRAVSGKYILAEYPEGNSDTEISYELLTKKQDLGSGLPDQIEVRIRNGTDVRTKKYTRYCPKCVSIQTVLPTGWGMVPTFVVCVVGHRSQGKTSLLKALALTQNLATLGRAGYHQTIKPKELNGSLVEMSEMTVVNSLGATQIVEVRRKNENGESVVLANVLFRDIAGELFEGNAEEHPAWNLMSAHDDYPGPDAFLFVHSAANVGETGEEKAVDVYNILNRKNNKWPICGFVLTHMDEVKSWTTRPFEGHGSSVPVLDQDTFEPYYPSDVRYYAPERVIPRIKLEDVLVRQKFSLYDWHRQQCGPQNAKGFLVKSCAGIPGNSEQVSYDAPINVMDPFIYILNQLRLLSLSTT
jgi:hypothetical protein